MTGLELIHIERKRQQEVEGWSLEHDKQYTDGQLKAAALCYWGYGAKLTDEDIADKWPWSKDWWKPNTNRIKNLIKAGALYMAENDRTGTNECDEQIKIISSEIDQNLTYLREQIANSFMGKMSS